ncbi:MAG: hypothetical protein WCT53_05890 [Candidatus Gracilibacteria bacterium]|jgi:hypothetical protein
MFNFFNPIKVSRIEEGSHGDHWGAYYGFKAFNEETLLTEMNDLIDKKEYESIRSKFAKFSKFDGKLGMCILTTFPGLKMVTGYPIFKTERAIPFETHKISEWNYDERIEAYIAGKGRDIFGLKFFATDYLENKEIYKSKQKLNIAITGFAYVLKHTQILPQNAAPDFVGYVPDIKLANDSAIDFIGTVLEAEYYNNNNTEGYILTCKLINHPEIEDCFNLEMFVNRNNMRTEEIKVNDKISGCCWLQGRIIQ